MNTKDIVCVCVCVCVGGGGGVAAFYNAVSIETIYREMVTPMHDDR
jgi:hypothetical protein